MSAERPVSSSRYDESYYLQNCGGSEFFSRYGAEILKPQLAYSFKRAGVAPGMSVLDIGCGRGEILFHVRRAGAAGVGTDYAEPALRIAADVSGCPVLLCDAKSLPFADAAFDRVFLLGVMDHLLDWELEKSFAEIRRVLKPGGKVVIHTCCNRLYYKRLTYGARRVLARGLGALGLPVREPSPPRSGEDEALHVNEHSLGSLRSFFQRTLWLAEVEPRPNYKLAVREIYGESLPADFPLKPASAWRIAAHRLFLWHPLLRAILAREFFCIATPA
ncbi:MAG: class I SAM-dependent methyltransferase [Elusimicrobia bacterium]|nr:class I SAM-dependent methyltransferase [Elusimicrobiota bacterium]